MVRLFFLWLFSAGIASAALGQIVTVPVRTGEHQDFTRLVIPLPAEITWQLRQDGATAVFTVDDQAVRFDTSQSFRRIPRTRLRDLRAQDSRLVLTLACNCVIRAAEDLPQMVVLDIVDATGPTTAFDFGRQLDVEQQRAIPQRAGATLAQILRSGGEAPQGRSSFLTDLVPVETARAQPQPIEAAGPLVTQTEMAQALGTALSAAVTQGLLHPSARIAPETQASARDEAGRFTAPQGNDINVLEHITVADSVLRARSANSGLAARAPTVDCPEPGQLSPATWFTTPPDMPRLAPADLFSERDAISADGVRQSTRALLYWGFGVEARLLLSLAPTDLPDHEAMAALSFLVDLNTAAPEADVLQAMSLCGPSEAFWAAMSTLPEALASDFPVGAAVQGALLLPHPLRANLGRHLVEQLSLQGHITNAAVLFQALERQTSFEAPEALQFARLFLEEGGATTAPSGSPSLLQPDDLMSLLQHGERTNTPTAQSLQEDAAALAYALRNDPTGAALAEQLLFAALRDNDYVRAINILNDQDIGLPPDQKEQARARILLEVTTRATDADFLRLIFAEDPWSNPTDQETTALVAARLDGLGFGDLAADMITRRQMAGMPQQSPDPAPGRAAVPQAEFPGNPANPAGQSSGPADQGVELAPARTRDGTVPATQPNALVQTGVPNSAGDSVNALAQPPAIPEAAPVSGVAGRLDQSAFSGDGGTTAPAIGTPQTAPPEAAQPADSVAAPNSATPIVEALALPAEQGMLQAGREALATSSALRTRIADLLERTP